MEPKRVIVLMLVIIFIIFWALVLMGFKSKDPARVAMIEILKDEHGRTYMRASYSAAFYHSRCEVLEHIHGEWVDLCSQTVPKSKPDPVLRFGE